MSTFNGLPVHVLLVHFVVVLAPLTAALTTLCAVWPAARRRFVWLALALSVATLVLTPLTAEAGEWLEHRVGGSAALETHAERGDTMLYVAIGLVLATALVALLHLRPPSALPAVVIAAVVIALSAAAMVQVVRIGDSGARAAWGDFAANIPPVK